MERKPSKNSGKPTPKVAIAVALVLLIVLAVATVLISTANDNSNGKQSPKTSKKEPSHISAPADQSYIVQIAKKNALSQFFWLGSPFAGEQVRVDLVHRSGQLEVGYLDKSAQTAFSTTRPAFTILVVTQPFTTGRSLAVLKKLSSGIIKHKGYSVYLPPQKYLKQRRIFAVSDDLKSVGIVLSTGKATVPALRAVAERVKLTQVPASK